MSSDHEIAYVRVLRGDNQGIVYVLRDHSVFAMGRAPECQIQLADERAELRHGFILHDDGRWLFKDPHCREDTHINDIPTNGRKLEGGEIIRIGREELYFTFCKPQPRQIIDDDSGETDAPTDTKPPKVKHGTIAVAKKDVEEEVTGSEAERARVSETAVGSGVRIVVVDGDPRDIGKELELPLNREVLLGRSPECDYPLHDRKMSRCHCRIQQDGDRYRISDLSSLNGTVVNGLRAASARFGVGDYIRLGFTVIAVQRVREHVDG